MILNFGAKNFLSFKEGFEISLVLNAVCPEDIAAGGENVSSVLCLRGPNASGKSNALKALTFFCDFCCNSFTNKPEEKIQLVSFSSGTGSSMFFMKFFVGTTKYFYEIELTRDEIIRETLQKKVTRRNTIFKRDGNSITSCAKDLKELEIVKLRSNVSTISMAHQFEIAPLEEVYSFFAAIDSNIDPLFGEIRRGSSPEEISSVSKMYKDSSEIFDFVASQLESFDTGINGIRIETFKGSKEEDLYMPYFQHDTQSGTLSIPYFLESGGTKSLYSQLVYYKQALDTGGVLILDEFDLNLHPDILEPLVRLFLDKQVNRNHAQLIFSTHNTRIMDVLGKYRIVFVSKEDNESYLYRLDELPGDLLRNDRSIETIYNTGRIGGKPRL